MDKKVTTKWWEHLILGAMLIGSFSFALWAHLDTWSQETIGLIPSGYTEQDLDDVRTASQLVLDCWVMSKDPNCFDSSIDQNSPFYWELFDRFLDMLDVHRLGEPYELDTEELGIRMGMDWPEEERRQFANDTSYEDDGFAVVFVASIDLEYLESQWRTQLCADCALPYLKQAKIAEVHAIISPSYGQSGAAVTLYLRATENGWLLFDWEMS